LIKTADTDENGGLDLQEFMKAIKYPSKVQQWMDSRYHSLCHIETKRGSEVAKSMYDRKELRNHIPGG
jgi:hypothetical protein